MRPHKREKSELAPMKGFVFTLDMIWAAVAIMALLAIAGYVQSQQSISPQADISIHAQDVALMSIFGAPVPNVPASPNGDWGCTPGFRPHPITALQDPTLAVSWDSITACEVGP